MISVDDMAMIAGDLLGESDGEANGDEDGIVLSDDESEDSDTAYIAADVLGTHKDLVGQLANQAFLHGRTYAKDIKT